MEREQRRSQADLYSDDSLDSKKAKELLQESGILVDEWKSPDDYVAGEGFEPPILHAREGEFIGLERIKGFIELVKNRPRLRVK